MDQTFTNLVCTLPLTDEVFARLNTAERRSKLRENPYLTEAQWMVLWTKRLPAAGASWLVQRPLSASQIETVLASETRGSVLWSMYMFNQLSEAQQLLCIARATGDTFHQYVICHPATTPNARTAAAAKLHGISRLEWVAAFDAPTAPVETLVDELLAAAGDEVSIKTVRALHAATAKLCNARPEVVAALCERGAVPEPLRTTFAGSRHLVDPEHQALVVGTPSTCSKFVALAFCANPVADDQLVAALDHPDQDYVVRDAVRKRIARGTVRLDVAFECAADEAVRNRLLQRALPNQYRSTGRVGDLVALAHNPHMTPTEQRRIFDVLVSAAATDVRAEQLHAALRTLADSLGKPLPECPAEAGFWDTPAYTPEPPRLGHPLLDPANRPWSAEQITAAVAALPEMVRTRIGAAELTQLPWMDHADMYVYLYAALGTDPARWECACNLSHTHRGSLDRLCSAASKLAR